MVVSRDIHSILYKGEIFAEKKPSYDASKKVTRYFPGKIPQYAENIEDIKGDTYEDAPERLSAPEYDESQATVETPTSNSPIVSVHERRLRFLRNVTQENDASPVNVTRRRRQVVEQGTILRRGEKSTEGIIGSVIALSVGGVTQSKKKDDISDDDAREKKRQTALEARLKEEELLIALEKQTPKDICESEIKEVTESSVDHSSDESEDDAMRPLFIPPSKRTTVGDHVVYEADKENSAKDIEERRQESRNLLVSAIAEEEEQERKRLESLEKGSWDPETLPDDDDTVNEEAEYELWKIREMQRIIRNREERLKREAFLKEIERRRNMTDEERKEDDRRLDAQHPKGATPSKYKFMQKYYHKGAFFQDLTASGEEPLYLRDYNVPVGEDAIDKHTVPKPMRLRRDQFGKAGQVKHTHLADVDTTDFTSSWYKVVDPKIRSKMAGLKQDIFERPRAKRKR